MYRSICLDSQIALRVISYPGVESAVVQEYGDVLERKRNGKYYCGCRTIVGSRATNKLIFWKSKLREQLLWTVTGNGTVGQCIYKQLDVRRNQVILETV